MVTWLLNSSHNSSTLQSHVINVGKQYIIKSYMIIKYVSLLKYTTIACG